MSEDKKEKEKEEKKEKEKVEEFLTCCGNFKEAIDKIDNFEKKWGERYKKTINKMNSESILAYSDERLFEDFKSGLKKVFKKCFGVPLKEKKRSSQTKKVLEDIIEKIANSKQIENLKQAFELREKKSIRKPRIYYKSVKEKFGSFWKKVEELFEEYEKILKGKKAAEAEAAAAAEKAEQIIEEIKKLVKEAGDSEVELSDKGKLVKEKLAELKTLVEKIGKLKSKEDSVLEAMANAKVVTAIDIGGKLDELKESICEISNKKGIILESIAAGSKEIQQGKVDNTRERIEVIREKLRGLESDGRKLKKLLEITVLKEKIVFCKLQEYCKFDTVTEKFKQMENDYKEYLDHQMNIKNGLTYENKTLYILDCVKKIGPDDVKNYRDRAEHVVFEGENVDIKVSTFDCYRFLKSVTLPSKLTKISELSFARCPNLQTIDLSNVTTIDEKAFYSCNELKEINIPNVQTIGLGAFTDCSKLKEINIPNVQTIGSGAFTGCSKLKEINIPKVTMIQVSTFSGCTSLQTITFPDGIKQIGDKAFNGCTSLKEVTFKGNIPKIGENAFPKELEKIKCKEEETESIKEAIGNSKLKFEKI